jgi:Ser/Thr protein kinase RdoA (MazF antagonist)
MQPELISRILELNRIPHGDILSPQKGYRNTSYPVITGLGATGASLNVIIFKREPGIIARIKRADLVSDFLTSKGFPARQTRSNIIVIKTKTGTHEHIKQYARCYTYLPGETIPWEAYTMKHLKLLGQTMSHMHNACKDFSTTENVRYPSVVEENDSLITRMRRYFRQPGVQRAMQEKLSVSLDIDALTNDFLKISELLQQPQFADTKQILHMDFVRGNILFREAELTGILDFEKVAFGARVYDIARTLAFLLVDCKYKEPTKIRKYFLDSGYQKRGGNMLSDHEKAVLEQLVGFYLFHDFYKFLRHNPYESLHTNLHFLRTRDILIKNDIIKLIR